MPPGSIASGSMRRLRRLSASRRARLRRLPKSRLHSAFSRLPRSTTCRVRLPVVGGQVRERLVFLPFRREGTFLEGDKVLPVVILTGLNHRSVGIDGIQAQAQAKLGEVLLQPAGQTGKGLQLTVR